MPENPLKPQRFPATPSRQLGFYHVETVYHLDIEMAFCVCLVVVELHAKIYICILKSLRWVGVLEIDRRGSSWRRPRKLSPTHWSTDMQNSYITTRILDSAHRFVWTAYLAISQHRHDHRQEWSTAAAAAGRRENSRSPIPIVPSAILASTTRFSLE